MKIDASMSVLQLDVAAQGIYINEWETAEWIKYMQLLFCCSGQHAGFKTWIVYSTQGPNMINIKREIFVSAGKGHQTLVTGQEMATT